LSGIGGRLLPPFFPRKEMMVMAVAETTKPVNAWRGLLQRLVDALSDNMELTNEAAAVVVGSDARTVAQLRKSDSFRTLLMREVNRKYGDKLHAVTASQLDATIAAARTVTSLLQLPEVLPSVKLEAAKVAFENHHRTADRLAPKNAPLHGQTNVTVELNFSELQAARKQSVDFGKTLELGPSDVAHGYATVTPTDRNNMLESFNQVGAPLRKEGE
jgi:hypothetical protein